MSQSTAGREEGERTVKARVRDPELLAALDDAEEDRTMADIVRSGLRAELLKESAAAVDGGVDPLVREGWETLTSVKRPGDTIRLEVAENTIAQGTQISSDYVRDTILTPLQNAGLIGVQPQAVGDKVMIQIGNASPKPTAAETVAHGRDCDTDDCDNTARFLIEREDPLTGEISGSADCLTCTHQSGAFPYEDRLLDADVSDDVRREAGIEEGDDA